MTPSLDHPTSEEIIKEIYLIQLGSYISLSSLVLYLYYYVTTLDSEFSVMWVARFGIGKFLFYSILHLALRYVHKYWLIVEAITIVLALHVGIQNIRKGGGSGRTNHLLHILVKNSIFQFVVIFSLSLVCQLVWSLADQEYSDLPAALSLSIGSALNQHLLIDIRVQASKERRIKTDFSLERIRSHSGSRFDEGVHNRSFSGTYPTTATVD
ncbi:hypothetical protein PNOK_0829700 [Pyrrhoderma noxium]|uniref:Uncharacterized protein n=1 Tax=Pyrrhoderma noxium TaxID=2282107 RepID=A0A286UAT8_9AGAM|nr:hypothetical protein PNOK_0829700 [Pyrrhoderma noxium]